MTTLSAIRILVVGLSAFCGEIQHVIPGTTIAVPGITGSSSNQLKDLYRSRLQAAVQPHSLFGEWIRCDNSRVLKTAASVYS